jgi:hypothetical protein
MNARLVAFQFPVAENWGFGFDVFGLEIQMLGYDVWAW